MECADHASSASRRLIVVGGSSAGGFGVEKGESYSSIICAGTDLSHYPRITYSLRLAEARRVLDEVEVAEEDVLILHAGIVDSITVMPKNWYVVVKLLRRGRGRLEAVETDRRTWSRIRRRFSVEVERRLASTARLLAVGRPITLLSDYEATCAQTAAALSRAKGMTVIVVSEHGPDARSRFASAAYVYSQTFEDLVAREQIRPGRRAAIVRLAKTLQETDYLEDGFHPNAAGHRKIADECLRILEDAALAPRAPSSGS